ncbi:hypothetical protein C1646_759899 [Rhizophagus diaphanus]|nr:hypothetical protein C1646_759899 [Rhizophagus diaphanus] [Rhizophagus sp. MUCL 43196]
MFLLVDNVPNSVVDQSNNASSKLCKEDRKIYEFLDLVRKKSVSDGIRQRNKKLQNQVAEQILKRDLSRLISVTSDDDESTLKKSSMVDIELFCLVQGNTNSQAFPLSININEDIGQLKKAELISSMHNDKELTEHISLELARLLNEVEYLGRDQFIRVVRKLKPDETPIPYDFQSLRINGMTHQEVRDKIYKFVSYKCEDSLFIDHFPIPWDDDLENRHRRRKTSTETVMEDQMIRFITVAEGFANAEIRQRSPHESQPTLKKIPKNCRRLLMKP